jgi:hypothetical protein
MYAALWRLLPGPAWLRVIILVVSFCAILAACIAWVFPWAQEFVFPQEVTVGQ